MAPYTHNHMQKSSQGLVISKAPITSIGIYTPPHNKHHTIQHHYENSHVRKGSYYQQDHSHDTTLCARNATKSPPTHSSTPPTSTIPQNTDAGWQHSRPEVTPDAHHHRRARIQDARRRTKHPHTRRQWQRSAARMQRYARALSQNYVV